MTLYFWREQGGWSTRLWWSREGSEESTDRQPCPTKIVRKRNPRSGAELGDGLTYTAQAPLLSPGQEERTRAETVLLSHAASWAACRTKVHVSFSKRAGLLAYRCLYGMLVPQEPLIYGMPWVDKAERGPWSK